MKVIIRKNPFYDEDTRKCNDVYVDGQVDIFFIEDNKISIVDFKSNKVPNSNLYSKQLNYYAGRPNKSFEFGNQRSYDLLDYDGEKLLKLRGKIYEIRVYKETDVSEYNLFYKNLSAQALVYPYNGPLI